MDMNEPTARVEVLSDRSESSHSETQLHAFREYEKMKELNLSMSKPKDDGCAAKSKDFSFSSDISGQHVVPFDRTATDRRTRELPVALDKSKEFNFTADKTKDVLGYPLDRSDDADGSLDTPKDYAVGTNRPKDNHPTTKDMFFGLDGFKEIHFPRGDARSKNFHAPLDRTKELNLSSPETNIKEFDLPKNYSLPLDRRKDINLSLDRMRDTHFGNLALERLRGKTLLENPAFLEPSDFRNPQIQSRNELGAMAIGRMRRSHLLTSDPATQNLATHLPHSHPITTHMQQSQQQQQQQAAKSFTIDAILGLRNNQRDKQQRGQQQQYRKHQGQEGSGKNGSSGSSSSGGGKLKRVRTIFTAEQLERLEGEFARQQYMVGPERLYLAHALRLTEAQVKVWFQNRRIKWRKVNHEQSQRLHELHQHSLSSVEHEDSNETNDWRRKRIKIAYQKCRDVLSELRGILDTISEHTEPSPTTSTTMELNDLELQSLKPRRGRGTPSRTQTWSSRSRADGGGGAADVTCWKSYDTRPNHSFPHGREERRQEYSVTEPATSCYSGSHSCRQKHRSSSSAMPKLPQISHPEQEIRCPQNTARIARNKLLTNNMGVVRKNRYKIELDDDDDIKYEEEDANSVEENAEEETVEEAVDEDQEETYEFEKDFEEQEVDDEVDDESDAFQTQSHRVQRRTQKDSLVRAQQLRVAEHQQEARRMQHQQRLQKMQQDRVMARCYATTLGGEHGRDTSYGDVPDAVSEEETTPPPTPPRRSSRRASATRQNIHHPWAQPRRHPERFSRTCRPSSPPPQQNRRPRTMKPELEALLEPQGHNGNSKKCCLCGEPAITAPPKHASSRKANCRLQDNRGFTVAGPIGEDGEAEELNVCGRCAVLHNMEDLRVSCAATTPPVSLYVPKPRRARNSRSPIFETTEDCQAIEDIPATYAPAPPRPTREFANTPRERTRHSMQSARGSPRRSDYYGR